MAIVAPGFYGKLPSHGDFIRRRLSGAFIDVWDSWLQTAMASSKEQLGAGWVETYLNSPLWRFVFAPGVSGPQMTAGVFMPSVDRAGRYFPMTLAVHVTEPVNPLQLAAEYDDWFSRAETLLLSALDDSMPFDLDVFDVQVESCGLDLGTGPGLPADSGTALFPGGQKSWHIGISSAEHLSASLSHLHWLQLRDQFNPLSLWWTNGSAQVAPGCLVCEGIPSADSFAAMLDGGWAARRWPSIALEASSRQSGSVAAAVPPVPAPDLGAQSPAGGVAPDAPQVAPAAVASMADEVPSAAPAAETATPAPSSTPYIPEFDLLDEDEADADSDLPETEPEPAAVTEVPATATEAPAPAASAVAAAQPTATASAAEPLDAVQGEGPIPESTVVDPLDALEIAQPTDTSLDPLEALGLTEPGIGEISDPGPPDALPPADTDDVADISADEYADTLGIEDTVPAATVVPESADMDTGADSAIVYSSAVLTQAGAGRDFNEDAVLERSDMAMWAVADGSGGHWIGDVASQAVVSELRTVAPSAVIGDLTDALKDKLLQAHRYLQQNLDRDADSDEDGGAAVAKFVAVEGMSACLSTGPVRLYRARNGSVERLTPDSDLQSRQIGHDGELLIDSQYHQVDAGDWFILCSHGLFDVIDESGLAQVAVASNPKDACEHLVASANSRGAEADLSVAVIHADAQD